MFLKPNWIKRDSIDTFRVCQKICVIFNTLFGFGVSKDLDTIVHISKSTLCSQFDIHMQ